MPDPASGLIGMTGFLLGIALILTGGVAAIFLPERFRPLAVAVGAGAALPAVLASALPVLLGGPPASLTVILGQPIGAVVLGLDPLSAFFAFLVAVAAFPGTLYAIGYLRPYQEQGRPTGAHCFFLAIFIAFMLLAVALRNALAFLVAWEIMSLSSLFLVTFEHEREEVLQAGMYYLIATHLGVAFLIAGFALLSIRTGSLDFDAFRAAAPALGSAADVVFLLLFVGFGLKAGFVPLHTWLPRAHPAAPSHISGLMSGVMIKLGIYGILRALTFIGTPAPYAAGLVLGLSVLTAALGVMYAIAQHDLKRLLAYHSVENIGIIGIGIGTGMLGLAYDIPAMAVLGFSGGILHVLNHSLFKGLLFYGAGAVYLRTHTRDIELLGGLVHSMRWTAALFLTGSLAISGLPPFNGFVSEFLVYLGMLGGIRTGNAGLAAASALSVASLAFIGAMAFLCFTKAFGVVFLGSPRSDRARAPKEVDGVMIAAMGLLAAACALIGLFPQYAVQLTGAATLQITGLDSAALGAALGGGSLGMISRVCFLFLGILIAVLLLRGLLLRGRPTARFRTWDCGYQAGTARMQYTASSYAGPFVELVRRPLNLRTDLEAPEGLFPERAHIATHARDVFETWGINPLVRGLRLILDRFSWLQSGNTQQYVLYGLVFLVLVLCWVMGVHR